MDQRQAARVSLAADTASRRSVQPARGAIGLFGGQGGYQGSRIPVLKTARQVEAEAPPLL
jgi:hypothetical protein